jgi:hypothetical protein
MARMGKQTVKSSSDLAALREEVRMLRALFDRAVRERNSFAAEVHRLRHPAAADDANVSAPQRLQREMMRLATFNQFLGHQVVADLLAHGQLWNAALMKRDGFDLLLLRDLAEGEWSADTLYLLTTGDRADALKRLARTWHADEVDWLDRTQAFQRGLMGSDEDRRTLVLWWD